MDITLQQEKIMKYLIPATTQMDWAKWKKPHTSPHVLRFHVYGMSKIGESIEIESGLVVFYGSKQVEKWVYNLNGKIIRKRIDICICITEPLGCIPESNTHG